MKKTKYNLGLVFFVALIIFMIPFFVQLFLGSESLVGEESYYHYRMIGQFSEKGIQDTDILMQRPYSFNLFHGIFGLLGISSVLLTKIIPIIFGIISLFIFYLILKEIKMDEESKIFTIIILILSPLFIYNSTVFNPNALSTCLLLLTAYLFLKKNYFSIITFCAAILTNFPASIAVFVLMVAYGINNNVRKMILLISTLFGVGLIILSSLFIGFNPLFEIAPISLNLTNLLTSFGAMEGYSLISIILAIIGIQYVWQRRLKTALFYSLTLVLFLVSFIYPEIRLVVSLIIVGLSGSALSYFVKRKWNIDKLKSITLILIVCSLLFSSSVFLKNESTLIDDKKIEAVKYLSATEQSDVIISAEHNSFLIESIANRKVHHDEISYKYDDYENRINVANSIFYSRNLDELELILNKYNINHILIDEDMRQGGIWGVRDEGILFLLETSKSFVKIFDNEEIQIYRYVGEVIQ